MKKLLIGLLTFTSISVFADAECRHNKSGDFAPFELVSGVPTLKYGSKTITLTHVPDANIVVTIKGQDGTTHVYGEKSLLIDFISDEHDIRIQVFCER